MTTLDDFKQFVTDEQAAAYYQKWASQNPGELSRWTAFRDSILGGVVPPKPLMITKFGAALIDAGMTYLDSLPPKTTPLPVPVITMTGTAKVGSTLVGTITYA